MGALKEKLISAAMAHVAPRVASALHRAGRPDLAKSVSRWTVVLAGTSRLLEQLDGKPSEGELRAICWALGEELGAMGDPTAVLFLTLAEGPADALDLRTLVPRIDQAMEDVAEGNGLRAADKIAEVWNALRRFTVVAEPAEKVEA